MLSVRTVEEPVGQVRDATDAVDAGVGGGDQLAKVLGDEVGQLAALEAGPQPLARLRSGAYAGSRSTTSHDRCWPSHEYILRLRWAGSRFIVATPKPCVGCRDHQGRVI